MKKCLVIISLLVVALGMPTASRADTTYNVSLFVGTASIVGDIVTDGTMGTVDAIDIFSFSFGVSNVGSTTTMGGSSAREGGDSFEVHETGGGLTATSAGLFYDFDTTNVTYLSFLNPNDGFDWCIFTDEGCDPSGSGESVSLLGNSSSVTGLSGDVMIASAPVAPTPEPGAFGLTLIGMVGLVLAMRKRKVQALRLDA